MSPDVEQRSRAAIKADHIAQLFDETPSLIASASIYLYEAWRRGDNLLVAARPVHWNAISAELTARDCPIGDLVSDGKLVALDAATTLTALMGKDGVQRESFEARVFPLVARLAQEPGIGLTIYGEMVDILATRGDFDAAEQLEVL